MSDAHHIMNASRSAACRSSCLQHANHSKPVHPVVNHISQLEGKVKLYLVGALGSLFVLAGASSAVAAPQSTITGSASSAAVVRPMHVSYCNNFVNYGTSWTADCRVDYGKSGAWTECSDGSQIYGPSVGPGYWKFGGNCSGHGTVRNWAVYNVS